MTNLIQPGITLNNGEVIGSMSDLDCFRQFSFDASTYIDAINVDGGIQLDKPKNGNGHNKPIYRIGKIGKTQRNATVKKERKATKAENLAKYMREAEAGLPLSVCSDDELCDRMVNVLSKVGKDGLKFGAVDGKWDGDEN